jgi:integrase
VHIRDAKGNKDRLVPLPENALRILKDFWSVHKHPAFIFPNRKRGLKNAHLVDSPLDRWEQWGHPILLLSRKK